MLGRLWAHSMREAASFGLFGARATSSLLSFVISLYLARELGGDEFGRYAFVVSFLTFVSIFFDLGYFASGAKLLVTADEKAVHSFLNAMFAIGITFAALFIVIAALAGLVVDHVFRVKIGGLLLQTAWLSPAFVFPYLLEQLLKAIGRIHLLSIWLVATKLLTVVVLVYALANDDLNTRTACAAYMAGPFVASMFVFAWLRPGVAGVKDALKSIQQEQKRFGRPLYLGKLAHLASYHSDKLIIAALANAVQLGWYTLAMALAGGVSMFGQAVAANAFRDFQRRTPIAKELLRRSSVGLVTLCVVSLAVGAVIVQIYLGSAYQPVIYLLLPACLATAFQGAYQPYNSWLLANGFGREIRNFLFVVAGVNVVGNALLILVWGIYGAAVASVLSMVTYWWLARGAYRAGVRVPVVAW